MTAEDVAATFNLHADPDNGSNALSAFTGVLSKGGAQATDPTTVVFELEAPNGNFPFSTSSDNYNLIILPKGFDPTTWVEDLPGHRPVEDGEVHAQRRRDVHEEPRLLGQVPRSRCPTRTSSSTTRRRTRRSWASRATRSTSSAQFSPVNGKPLLTDTNLNIIELRASQHRQLHMRTDKEPFNDKSVRQAVALLINRDNIVKGLLEEKSDYGNDSPFAPVYPSTDKSVAQRKQDVEKAKQLLADAGKSNISVELRGWNGFEMPQYAQLVQNDLKAAGINVKLNFTDSGSYYGDAVFGKSPWLDSVVRASRSTAIAAPRTCTSARR